MTDRDWFILFDTTKDSFKWFWLAYGFSWSELIQLRKDNKKGQMISMMNEVWFALPDSRFNIVENPAGWKEFLALIEE